MFVKKCYAFAYFGINISYLPFIVLLKESINSVIDNKILSSGSLLNKKDGGSYLLIPPSFLFRLLMLLHEYLNPPISNKFLFNQGIRLYCLC